MRPIKLKLGDIPPGVFSETELEAMGSIEAPFVDPDACTGCGLCEYRCHTAYTKHAHLLSAGAIRVIPKEVAAASHRKPSALKGGRDTEP
jgi:ferredoxin